ncbi:DUF302 domain-containing protein [Marimonas lutisalis]|uniref:DUF302 domain-containing protein n=1 Tax=Marimonas lutisalis TaxID=2545756 RepID=UPI0010F62573|nr:DUF302 domain-containing protein [Marimonas lutisalis]
MKRILATAAVAACLAGPALSEGVISYTTDEAFDDVVFGLENAIVDAGLVVDSVSHVGDMLERTKEDVGGTVTIFEKADVYSFCSAAVSRRAMEADPMNIVYCPYGIFVAQQPGGQVMIGFRDYPDGPMQEVEAMLDGIAKSAIGME